MKKNIRIYFMFLVTLFFVAISTVKADSYDFTLVPYNVTTACDLELDGGQICFERYLAGELDSYQINNNIVEANENVMLILMATPSSDSQMTGIQLAVKHDTSKVSYYYSSYGAEYGTLVPSTGNLGYDYSFFPIVQSGRQQLKTWTISGEPYIGEDSVSSIIYTAGNGQAPLVKQTPLAALFYTVSASVTPGTDITFEFDSDPAETDIATPTESLTSKGNFNSLTLSILSNVSKDGTLKTLTATGNNSLAYTFGFVPSSKDNLDYNIIVPNSVDEITFAGTATDSNIKGIVGLDTAHSLNVGDNTINILVTAESGDITIYKMTVRRLSNDATLSSVTATNDVNFGNITAGTYKYTYTVPYKTENTVVTAKTTSNDATITSGLGTWQINTDDKTNYKNTYQIEVSAENCKYDSTQVPGNVCTTQIYNFEITRTAPSTDLRLKDIKVDGTTIAGFDPDVYTYTLPVAMHDKTSVQISATLNDSLNKITSGTGTHNVIVGENKYEIIVTGEDGITTKKYTLYLHKGEDELLDLTITTNPASTLSPTFTSSFKGDYTYTYDPNVTQITVSATVKDTGYAYVSIVDMTNNSNPTNTNKVLNTDSKTFGITTTKVGVIVTAADGHLELYTINLSRTKSSNNFLSSLSINPGTINETFNASNGTYTATVDADVTSVTVNAVKADKNAEITSITGNTDFKFGAGNIITIKVTAEDGTPRDYTINVTRKQYDIATLDDLRIGLGNATPTTITNWNKNTFTYSPYVLANPVPFNTDKITIEYDKGNEYQTVSGDIGTKSLKTGDNQFKITVKSQDGTITNDYIINVYRAKNTDNETKGVSVAGYAASKRTDGNYEVTLPNSITSITPSQVVISASDDAIINKVTGNLTLSTQTTNIFEYTITSESGVAEYYKIYITREKSSNANITRVNLTLDGETTSSRYCVLEENETACTIEVPVGTTKYSLSAVIDPAATISPVNGTEYTMSASASDSTQTRTLVVTAENNSQKTYTITIVRAKSSNAKLSSITITDITNGKNDNVAISGYSPEKNSYNIVVPATTTTLQISAVLDDIKASIDTDMSQPITLKYGLNQYTIDVTAEDGTTKNSYTLNITRSLGIDATLKDLKIDATTIRGFTSSSTSYVLNSLNYNDTSIDLQAITNDTNASITSIKINNQTHNITTSNDVTTTIAIPTGTNTITVTVTAHDGSTTKNYKIEVERKLNDDTGIQNITVAGVPVTTDDNGNLVVTVPNSVTDLDSSNVSVTVNDPATTTDAKATYTVQPISLDTQNTNNLTITVTAENGSTEIYTVYVTRTKSNDNTLTRVNLTTQNSVQKYCIIENDKCTIEVPVDTTSFKLEGIIADTATISPANGINHDMPSNTSTKNVTLTVTAEDGTPKDYVVTVERQLSSDNTLSDLKVDGTTIAGFSPSIPNYNYTIPGTQSSVTVSATVADTGKATIVTDLSKPFAMNYGQNTIEVVVNAENGQPATYTINVTRLEKTDNTLQSLLIDSEEKITSIQNDEITINVPYSKTTIDILGTPTDNQSAIEAENAKVLSGNGTHNLSTGLNTIEVVVAAQNRTLTKTYTIKVNRALNNDTGIKGIKFNTGESNIDAILDPTDQTNKTYIVTVPNNITQANQNNVIVTVNDGAVSTDKLAEYIVQTTSLDTLDSNGNQISNNVTITVTAEDGTIATYTLIVKRTPSANNTLNRVNVYTDGSNTISNFCLFEGENTACQITVGVTTTSFRLEGILEDNEASIEFTDGTITGDTYNMSTSESIKTITATVTAEDGTPKDYTITVVRTKSSNAALKTIKLNLDGSSNLTVIPNFSETKTSYDATNDGLIVAGTQDSITIYAEAFDAKSKIKTATVTDTPTNIIQFDHDLTYGAETTIIITVVAEDGTEVPYSIKIKRSLNIEPRLDDIIINGNSINNYLPNGTTFDNDANKDIDDTTYEYTLLIQDYNQTSINIQTVSMDPLGRADGTGTKQLQTIYYGTDFTTNNEYVNTFIIKAYADDESVYRNYTIHVKRKANNDTGVQKVEMIYDGSSHEATYDANERVYKITVPNNVTKANTSNVKVTVNEPQTTTDAYATYKMNETILVTDDSINGNVNTHKFTVIAEDGTEKEYTLLITREKSNVAYLSDIQVLDPNTNDVIGTFNKTFNKDTLTYTVTVPVTTVDYKIVATPYESHSTISGTGTYTLTSSTDTKTITVSSEDQSASKTYTLNIVRVANDNKDLGTLTVKDENGNQYEITPEITDGVYNYKATVPGTVNVVTITATPENSLARVEYVDPNAGTTNEYNVVKGINTKQFNIISESGNSQPYYIEIEKLPKTVATLSSLTYTLGNGSVVIMPNFDPTTYNYFLDEVPYSISTIYISATPTDSDATVSGHIAQQSIATGPNKFTITVTAEDGKTTQDYTISVSRKYNNVATLDLLSIKGASFNETYDKNTFNYTTTVLETREQILQSDITYFKTDENATVTLDPDLTLSTSAINYYKVTVTAEDKVTTNTYTIAITRPKSSDNLLKSVELQGATLSPTFSPTVNDYTITVPYGQTNFTITGTPNASTSTVVGNGVHSISEGSMTITVRAENGAYNDYRFTILEAKSSDAKLSSLEVQGYPFVGEYTTFSPTQTLYSIGEIDNEVEKVKVNATPANANSTIEYYNNGTVVSSCTNKTSCEITLPTTLGAKDIQVKVTAPDGTSKIPYNINYVKIASRNTKLINIVSDKGTWDKTFNPGTLNYVLSVDNKVDTVNLTITAESSNATIKVNDGTVAFSPSTVAITSIPEGGTKTATILVTAEDKNYTETYTVLIKRAAYVGSSDATLKSLAVTDKTLSPVFSPNTENYSIGEIPYSLSQLTINAIPNVAASSISYYVNGIQQSSNIVTIPKANGTISVKVTAEDNKTTKTYSITYTKNASQIAYLESLIVSKGTLSPSFNKNTFIYNVTLPNDETSIDITAKTEDNNATVKINNNNYISNSVFTMNNIPTGTTTANIVVTAEDGKTQLTYKVNITRESLSEVITSEVYGHIISDGFIKSVSDNTTVLDMKNQLDNDNSKLEIWKADDSVKVSDNAKVGTGMIVKLIINNKVVDSKIIIILGDVNGDGIINVIDSSRVLNHFVQRTLQTGPYLVAADVNKDGIINVIDSSRILNHFVQRSTIAFR